MFLEGTDRGPSPQAGTKYRADQRRVPARLVAITPGADITFLTLTKVKSSEKSPTSRTSTSMQSVSPQAVSLGLVRAPKSDLVG